MHLFIDKDVQAQNLKAPLLVMISADKTVIGVFEVWLQSYDTFLGESLNLLEKRLNLNPLFH